MKMFKKVAIIGTGLIGGSIGMAIKKAKLAGQVIGVSRHAISIQIAKKKQAIDIGSTDFSKIRGVDFVILATPVKTILSSVDKISRFIDKECLITDVGSTKSQIVERFSANFKNFVGSHPLAGSEKRGVSYASKGLFKKSICIITPQGSTSLKAKRRISEFWEKLGARVVEMPPRRHDEILGFTSHLPHAASFALMDIVPRRYLKFSSTGLKDATRIASSDADIWADIFLSNNTLYDDIRRLEENLKRIRGLIKNGDRKRLIKILQSAKSKREQL